MKNKILFGLAFFILILFVNNVEAQEIGCCTIYEQNGDRFYCGLASEEECIGEIIGPSCGSLNNFDSGVGACEVVSCQKEETRFSGNVKRIQCIDIGGEVVSSSPTRPGSVESTSLERGGCIVDGECYEYVTRSYCENTISNNGRRTVEFDTSINSESQCQGWTERTHASQLGCCVETNSCERTFSDRCDDGTFIAGTRCDSLSQCLNSCGPLKERCESDQSGFYVFYENNCGVENVRALGNNEACRPIGTAVETVETFTTDCKVGEGSVTEIELLSGLRITEKTATITSDFLGGATERKNGDIWCYDIGEGTKPGDSHYVLKCQQGSVVIDNRCGTFRDGICESRGGIAECVPNLWESCMTCGQDGSWTNFGADCGENECLNLGLDSSLRGLSKSEKRGISHCVFDTSGKDECWPKYPPGFEFWLNYDQANINKVSGEEGWRCDGEVNALGCGEGGDKRLNQCDPNECNALGDCTYEGGHPYWGAAGYGVAYGATAYLGVTYAPAVVTDSFQKVIGYFGQKEAAAAALTAAQRCAQDPNCV